MSNEFSVGCMHWFFTSPPVSNVPCQFTAMRVSLRPKFPPLMRNVASMGFSMAAINFPVAKGTSGVTFLTDSETCLTEESQCISCGYCGKNTFVCAGKKGKIRDRRNCS